MVWCGVLTDEGGGEGRRGLLAGEGREDEAWAAAGACRGLLDGRALFFLKQTWDELGDQCDQHSSTHLVSRCCQRVLSAHIGVLTGVVPPLPAAGCWLCAGC